MRTALFRALVVAALVAPAATPVAGAACAGARTSGPWTTIDYPAFPVSARSSKVFPVGAGGGWPTYPRFAPGGTRNELYVTDGSTVARSTDRGCTWREVFHLTPGSVGDLTSTDVPVNAARPHASYVVQQMRAVPGTRALFFVLQSTNPFNPGAGAILVVTRDGGATWSSSVIRAACDVGQPAQTVQVTTLLVGDANRVQVVGQPLGEVFQAQAWLRSADGGSTWACTPDSRIGFESAVDPLNPLVAWTVKCSDVLRTTDGGRHWTALKRPWPVPPDDPGCNGVSALDVQHLRGRPATLVLRYAEYDHRTSTGTYTYLASLDGGTSWRRVPSPIAPSGESVVGVRWGTAWNQLRALVGVGDWSIAPPAGYVVRTWTPTVRGWKSRDGMAEKVNPTCKHTTISELKGPDESDRSRAELLVHADIYYGTDGCYALIRYAGR